MELRQKLRQDDPTARSGAWTGGIRVGCLAGSVLSHIVSAYRHACVGPRAASFATLRCMELAARIALVAALVYGVVVGLTYIVQRQLQYFPDRRMYSPLEGGVPEMSIIRFHAADGVQLVSWHNAAAAGAPTVVYFPGNGGNIAGRGAAVRPWIDAGYGVLLVGYRGYGGSDGRPAEEGLYADGRAAIAYLRGRGVPAHRIALYGESLGTGVAVKMAVEHAVGAVILEAPFTSAVDVGARAYPILPVRWLMKDRYESLGRIAAIDAPLLILHGQDDRTIPVTQGHRMLTAAREPKQGVFFAGAGHDDLRAHGADAAILRFLAATFPPE